MEDINLSIIDIMKIIIWCYDVRTILRINSL